MYLDEIFSLKGKVAVVTGGSMGIGKVIALGLSRAGASVVIISRNGGAETEKQIIDEGGSAYNVLADVTDEKNVEKAFTDIINRSGRVDVVFNNAGICIHKDTLDTSADEFKMVLDTNLTGAYNVSRAAGRKMIEMGIAGSIINNASMSGSVVNIPQMQASYNASKAGLVHLTRSLAVEWAPYHIRVNAISPGYISTPMSADMPKELTDVWMPMIPFHRMGTPEELIGAVVYLASQASTYTTGCNIVIDGGYTCL
jgi:NAD(P)-dependent dehydrogenase (short-subunit alcohol dehydrogenase family)